MKCQRLLLLNLGTTSFKFQLFDFSRGETPSASGMVERVGSDRSFYSLNLPSGKAEGACSCRTCTEAFALCVSRMGDDGVLPSLEDLDAVGFKAVHGGPLTGTRLVDEELLDVMEQFSPLAPAHNPVYLDLMRALRERYPGLLQAVRFETSFHGTIPDYRTAYGVPWEWREKWGIRRYGFHGSSHEYIAGRMRQLAPSARRVISIHLGGSSSLCAIRDGQSIASSMGATPQSGLIQNNRVGDFDVCCLPELARRCGGLNQAMEILCTRSGFLGLSGVSNDLREVLAAREAGDRRADLAVRAFADEIVGYTGMFAAFLGGLDAIAFTGGIGQNSGVLREMVCAELGLFSIRLLEDDGGAEGDRRISAADSGASVWVIKTDEEQVLARHTRALVESL